jgi:hypothetical protein
VNANLSLKAQFSYTSYSDYGWNNATFVGGEAVFKF